MCPSCCDPRASPRSLAAPTNILFPPSLHSVFFLCTFRRQTSAGTVPASIASRRHACARQYTMEGWVTKKKTLLLQVRQQQKDSSLLLFPRAIKHKSTPTYVCVVTPFKSQSLSRCFFGGTFNAQSNNYMCMRCYVLLQSDIVQVICAAEPSRGVVLWPRCAFKHGFFHLLEAR